MSSATPDVDWEVDVYGSAEDYIGTFTGHTSNGQIDFAWDLFDPQGVKQEDLVFSTVTTIYPPAASPPAPAPQPTTQLNPPSIKQVDNYPEEGMWTVARLDYIPHNSENYDLYEQAINSVAQMGEERGGVLPLPDGVHRNFGEAFLIRPTATNPPTDWTLWLNNGITNRNVRNLYYDGHGGPNLLGGFRRVSR